jgi:hypothetical protein
MFKNWHKNKFEGWPPVKNIKIILERKAAYCPHTRTPKSGCGESLTNDKRHEGDFVVFLW